MSPKSFLDLGLIQSLLTGVGNFVGPLVYEEKDAPRYVPGFIVVIVTSFVSAVLVLVYRFVCDRDNKRRDAAGTMEAFDNAYQDDLTDITVCSKSALVYCIANVGRIPSFAISCKSAVKVGMYLLGKAQG